MADLLEIETEPGLTFDVLADGAAGAPLLLLLHGFAESFHMWRAQLPALAAAGYRAVAPSQRGYSRRARPHVAEVANYHFDRLVSDAMALAARCGQIGDSAGGRLHLVGHDWGGGIAWGIADRYPERVASLTVLNRRNEVRAHIHAALNVGATRQEVAEVIFQQVTYGGMPVVVEALEVFKDVLVERGEWQE